MLYGKEEQVNIDYIGHIFYMRILLPSGNSVIGHAGSHTQPKLKVFYLISTVESKQVCIYVCVYACVYVRVMYSNGEDCALTT